jgi:hypothetical protein
VSAPLAIHCGSDGGADAPRAAMDGGTESSSSSGGPPGNTHGTDSGAASSDDGGTGPTPCAPAEPRDDFSGAALDTSTWKETGFAGWDLEIVDGRLTFTPNPQYNNTRAGLLRARLPFALTDCSTWLEVPRALPPNIQGEVTVSLSTYLIGSDIGFMRIYSGNLIFGATVAGKVETSTIPFDPAAHRWWRFREASGTLYLETSPDGRTWSEQFERVHGGDVTSVQLDVSVLNPNTPGGFDGPQFDNVNVMP